jgi:type I phosphodiesterase/nucleotide pyrophosphatase
MRGLKRSITSTIIAAGIAALSAPAGHADDGGGKAGRDLDRVAHVLLLSVDGLHAVDLAICSAAGTCPNLAQLAEHGITYTNASTTKPSDSFPGLLSYVSGATPRTTGVFYDDSYDRTLFAPGSNCTVGPGTETTYAENLGFNPHAIDSGNSASLTGLNSAVAIDPSHLPGQLVNGRCQPLWPHNFIRSNTVFGVIHARHLRTAWSDKHAAYDIVNGNDPDSQPTNGPGTNLDDFFAPEVNSDLSQANIDLIKNLGLHSTAPTPPVVAGADFTGTVPAVEWYDGIKVQAILNEIDGLDHTGKRRLGTPAIFGMNFQAVSVGQKLACCGYKDTVGTPSDGLANAIAFVDRSIGQMVDGLRARGLAERTLVIVGAKHGQSPIDRSKRRAFDDGAVIAAPIGSNFAFDIGDDGVLIWLKDNSAGKTAAAVAALNAFSGDTGIGEWLSGPLLTLSFQDPAQDSRTPDIIGIAKIGTIYTGGSKIAEHGGFNEDDTHVALIVSHPALRQASINAAVASTQVAPTILKVLGLDPSELDGVRQEGTPLLPDFD